MLVVLTVFVPYGWNHGLSVTARWTAGPSVQLRLLPEALEDTEGNVLSHPYILETILMVAHGGVKYTEEAESHLCYKANNF